MKIVLFGATGNVGRRVAAEALSRGHEVVDSVTDTALFALLIDVRTGAREWGDPR
jgi:putative NADH-flavin reductase